MGGDRCDAGEDAGGIRFAIFGMIRLGDGSAVCIDDDCLQTARSAQDQLDPAGLRLQHITCGHQGPERQGEQQDAQRDCEAETVLLFEGSQRQAV